VSVESERALLDAALAPFVADVRQTLEATFVVEVSPGEANDWGTAWTWSVWGTSATVYVDDSDDASRLCVQLAQEIPDSAFDHVLEPWPRCPTHNDHPLYPRLRAAEAIWECRKGARVRIKIGDLVEGTG
jgi:hypothetical protein